MTSADAFLRESSILGATVRASVNQRKADSATFQGAGPALDGGFQAVETPVDQMGDRLGAEPEARRHAFGLLAGQALVERAEPGKGRAGEARPAGEWSLLGRPARA